MLPGVFSQAGLVQWMDNEAVLAATSDEAAARRYLAEAREGEKRQAAFSAGVPQGGLLRYLSPVSRPLVSRHRM
jgi:hypothetical protein